MMRCHPLMTCRLCTQAFRCQFPSIACQPRDAKYAALRVQVESLKRQLNQQGGKLKVKAELDDVCHGQSFTSVLTRDKFDELCEDLFQQCFQGRTDGTGGLDELFGEGGKYRRVTITMNLALLPCQCFAPSGTLPDQDCSVNRTTWF